MNDNIKKVVVDAGHGGVDSGAKTTRSTSLYYKRYR